MAAVSAACASSSRSGNTGTKTESVVKEFISSLLVGSGWIRNKPCNRLSTWDAQRENLLK
jgi:hypothetical protein